MLIVIPYVSKLTDYEKLAQAIKGGGNLIDHSLHIVTRIEDEPYAVEFGNLVTDLFAKTTVQTIPDGLRTPIQLSNELFRTACRFLWNYKPSEDEPKDLPMLYFDPGSRPSKQGWANAIQAQFYLKRKDILGWFSDDEEGAPIPKGSLVLSREFVNKSGLLDSLGRESHWRSRLKWEFSKSFVNSDLIGYSKSAVITPETKKK